MASTTSLRLTASQYDLRDSYACKKVLEYANFDAAIHAAGSVDGILANRENRGKFTYDNMAVGMNMIERAHQHAVEFQAT